MAHDAIRWARINANVMAWGLATVGLIILAIECAGVLALAGYVTPLDPFKRLTLVAAVVGTGVVITAIAKAVQASYGQVADGAWEITWWTPGDNDLVIMLGAMIATGGVWLVWNALAGIIRRGRDHALEQEHAASILGLLLRAAEAQPIRTLPEPSAHLSQRRCLRLLIDLGLVDVSANRQRIWATTDAYKHARTVRERSPTKPSHRPT